MTTDQAGAATRVGALTHPQAGGTAPAPGRTAWAVRVTVVTPQARVDVALPLQSTVAELVPQLLRLSDAERHAGRDHTGWVLARLGGAPFALGLTVAAAGLRDGDVLYLIPRDRQAAPVLFDDVVDAIASAAENAKGAWRPRTARRTGIAAGTLVLAGATLLLFACLPGGVAPFGGGIATLLLLLGGGALSRAYGDADAGAACATAGVSAALLTGMSMPPPHHAWSLQPGALALGLTAATGYGVLAVALVEHWLAWFGCLTVAAGLGAVAAAVVSLTGVSAPGAGVVLAVVATALAAAAPMLALRLGRLPLPRVPSDIETFRAGDEPMLGPDVLDQTTNAQWILTGLLGALGLTVTGCVTVLLRGDDLWQALMASLLALVWLLRSRSYTGTAQRVALLATGLASLGLLGGWLVARQDGALLLGGFVVLTLAGVACLAYARRAAQGRHSPYWSRLMDVAEFLGVVALLPVAGQVLGVYQHVRYLVH